MSGVGEVEAHPFQGPELSRVQQVGNAVPPMRSDGPPWRLASILLTVYPTTGYNGSDHEEDTVNQPNDADPYSCPSCGREGDCYDPPDWGDGDTLLAAPVNGPTCPDHPDARACSSLCFDRPGPVLVARFECGCGCEWETRFAVFDKVVAALKAAP